MPLPLPFPPLLPFDPDPPELPLFVPVEPDPVLLLGMGMRRVGLRVGLGRAGVGLRVGLGLGGVGLRVGLGRGTGFGVGRGPQFLQSSKSASSSKH